MKTNLIQINLINKDTIQEEVISVATKTKAEIKGLQDRMISILNTMTIDKEGNTIHLGHNNTTINSIIKVRNCYNRWRITIT